MNRLPNISTEEYHAQIAAPVTEEVEQLRRERDALDAELRDWRNGDARGVADHLAAAEARATAAETARDALQARVEAGVQVRALEWHPCASHSDCGQLAHSALGVWLAGRTYPSATTFSYVPPEHPLSSDRFETLDAAKAAAQADYEARIKSALVTS